jgi:hypothetical protein
LPAANRHEADTRCLHISPVLARAKKKNRKRPMRVGAAHRE